MNERHWTWLICILTATIVVLAWPRVPAPENELLIQVYRTRTEFHENGEHLLTVFECADRTQVMSWNGHRCTDDLALLDALIEGYVPLPWHVIEHYASWD